MLPNVENIRLRLSMNARYLIEICGKTWKDYVFIFIFCHDRTQQAIFSSWLLPWFRDWQYTKTLFPCCERTRYNYTYDSNLSGQKYCVINMYDYSLTLSMFMYWYCWPGKIYVQDVQKPMHGVCLNNMNALKMYTKHYIWDLR